MQESTTKIGILGGTFDPIHIGHMILAQEVLIAEELSQVLFMPTGNPWMKESTSVTPGALRLEMVRLALEGEKNLLLSGIEIARGGTTYTVDTVRELHQREQGPLEVSFILGEDALEEIHRWKEPEALIAECALLVVRRPGVKNRTQKELDRQVYGLSSRVKRIDAPRISISSTDIRQRVREGKSIHHWVPESVEEFIFRHHLYQERNDR